MLNARRNDLQTDFQWFCLWRVFVLFVDVCGFVLVLSGFFKFGLVGFFIDFNSLSKSVNFLPCFQ